MTIPFYSVINKECTGSDGHLLEDDSTYNLRQSSGASIGVQLKSLQLKRRGRYISFILGRELCSNVFIFKYYSFSFFISYSLLSAAFVYCPNTNFYLSSSTCLF
jgi:hypothetical protein